MRNMLNGKVAKIGVVVGIAFGVIVGVSLAAALPAQANFFTDFWHNLMTPFSARPSSTFSPSSSTQLPAVSYQSANSYEQAVISAVKKASPAVVSITISEEIPILERCAQSPFSDIPPEFQQFFGNNFPQFNTQCDTGKKQLQEVGGGSGFIVSSDGLILTNKHVVADAKASYTVLTNDGKKYDAKVLARDPVQDLAVVKIAASNLPTVDIGDSDSLELGQTAIAIGNALGEFRNTVSVGVVSGLARTVTATDGSGNNETIQGVIQTDAAINPGNSGGPLLNLNGQVVGINTAIASNAQNVGFTIPINRAKNDINSVKTSGEIRIPYLGVRYISITPDLARSQNLPVQYGALVRGGQDGPAVAPDSPAAKAGLQAEDIIVKVNNTPIDAGHALGDVVVNYSAGDAVALTVNRAGKEITLQATLAKRPGGG